MTATLTIKQENFCLAYIETGNASEAYRVAYNAENMKAESIVVNASKLIHSAKVALRIEQLKESHRDRHAVTVDSLTTELDELRNRALDLGQCGAGIQASMGKAKLHGLLSETIHLKAELLVGEIERTVVKAP